MKFYLDTSVFGGYYDPEFRDHTRKLFEYIKEENTEVIYSDLLGEELEKAPEKVRLIVKGIENITYVEPNEDTLRLAELYVKEGAR